MSEHNTEDLRPTPGQRASRVLKRADVKQTFAYGVFWTIVFTVLGIYFYPRWMPEALSEDMAAMREIMIGFTVVSAPIAGLVLGITTQAVMNRHKGDTPPPDGPAVRTNGPVVVVWSVVSSLFCLVAVVWGLIEVNSMASAATNNAKQSLKVEVTGSQWVWSFKYPELGVESDRLMLPIDRPVDFEVVSVDVNHSFWPVQLGVKVDANNKAPTHVYTVPNKIGVIDVKCAELCGLHHAYMETDGEVMSEADFNAWVSANGGHSA